MLSKQSILIGSKIACCASLRMNEWADYVTDHLTMLLDSYRFAVLWNDGTLNLRESGCLETITWLHLDLRNVLVTHNVSSLCFLYRRVINSLSSDPFLKVLKNLPSKQTFWRLRTPVWPGKAVQAFGPSSHNWGTLSPCMACFGLGTKPIETGQSLCGTVPGKTLQYTING